MDRIRIHEIVDSIRAKSSLDMTNGIIDDTISSLFIGYYNSKRRYLFYEKMVRREGEVNAIVINLHGGGFVKGITTRDRIYSSYLAMNTSSEIWNAEYSLSPELPFPAALEDAYDLLMMAKKEKEKRSLPLILVGHSAGAWLIASLSVLLKRKKEKNPIDAAILDYPPLEFVSPFIKRVFDQNDKTQMDFARTVEIFTEAFYCQNDKADSIASPLFATDDELSEFPKAFFSVGQDDMLYPENMKFTEHLASIGRDVYFKLYPDSGHSFTTNRDGRFEEALQDHVDFVNANS